VKGTEHAGLREVLSMAWPMVVSLGSATLMQTVAFKFVASQGGTAGQLDVAAITPAGLLAFTVIALIDGLVTVNNAFVSQSLGAGRLTDCGRYTWQALYVAGALGVLLQVVQPLAPAIFALMPHPSEVQAREIEYFRIRLLGAAFVGFSVALGGFFQGISRPRIPMIAAIAANVHNVALCYILVYGRFGIPALGIRGAALATVLAGAGEVVTLLAAFFWGSIHRRYGTRTGWRPSAGRLLQFLRVGGPAAIHFMLDVGAWAAFVLVLVGRFGEKQLAASNIVGQFINLSWVPTVGINIATTQLVGQWIGRGRLDVALARARTALRLGMAYMLTMGLLFILFRRHLVALMLDDPAVIHWGVRIMFWAALFQVFDAIGIVLYGALKGAGDTLVPAVLVIASGWCVFLPAAWLFAVKLGYGAPGAWAAAAVHIALVAMLLTLRFRSRGWRTRRLVPAAPSTDVGTHVAP
jgi:MATE family multidrug resistance protein